MIWLLFPVIGIHDTELCQAERALPEELWPAEYRQVLSDLSIQIYQQLIRVAEGIMQPMIGGYRETTDHYNH